MNPVPSNPKSEILEICWLSFVAWRIILLKPAVNGRAHCGHKGRDMFSNNTQMGCGSKCANIPPNNTPLLVQGRMDACFHIVYTKVWPYHLNAAAQISCFKLIGVNGVVFCCYSPPASRSNRLYVQRVCIVELQLPSHQLIARHVMVSLCFWLACSFHSFFLLSLLCLCMCVCV